MFTCVLSGVELFLLSVSLFASGAEPPWDVICPAAAPFSISHVHLCCTAVDTLSWKTLCTACTAPSTSAITMPGLSSYVSLFCGIKLCGIVVFELAMPDAFLFSSLIAAKFVHTKIYVEGCILLKSKRPSTKQRHIQINEKDEMFLSVLTVTF